MYGEIWWVDFGLPLGSEPGFKRPAIIVQNDLFNKTAINTTIVIPLTTNLRLAEFPGNLQLSTDETLLPKASVAVVPQITAIDKTRLLNKIANLKDYTMFQLKENIKLLLQI